MGVVDCQVFAVSQLPQRRLAGSSSVALTLGVPASSSQQVALAGPDRPAPPSADRL
jgi:hypothetical protein